MSARLEGQAWLTSAATQAVIDALEAAGGPDCARFVGGCVRNALIGQAVDDIDIATTLKPEAAMAALKSAGLKVVPTGLAHGTVTAVSERRPYEITTLRRDVETDGRRAVVAFTDDWTQDASRRDFRLNALYADRTGEIFDPTGQGVADAAAGRIVFVGDAETRIREDYLRILRFFRFFAWYGRGEPDGPAMAACARLADGMDQLSAERVSRELLKLLAAPDPRAGLRAMEAAGVLQRVLPGGPGLGLCERMVDLTADPVLRLSALFPDKTPDALARSLRLPNAMRERLAAAVDEPALSLSMTDGEARAAIYRRGAQAVRDQVMRALAGGDDAGASDGERLLALVERWTPPSMPVGGKALARLGVAPGPETGRLLKAFEDAWIADDFPEAGHEARLKALIGRT